MSDSAPVIAVVGGGVSGILAVVHLLSEAGRRRLPGRVVLIDRHGRQGRGTALGELLAEAGRAAPPLLRLTHVPSDVVAIRRCRRDRPVRLHLGAEGRIDADIVILTLGGLPPVDCTGPAAGIASTSDKVLRDLLDRGIARPDPAGRGLETDQRGAVRDAAGKPASDIYVFGPLRGPWYSTTDVHEIRSRAAEFADILLSDLDQVDPRNAA